MTERTLVSPPSAASLFRRLGFLLPVLVFVVVAVGLGIGLTRNPQEIPSALIGKAVPEFSLPPVQGRTLGRARPARPGAHACADLPGPGSPES
jgi:hypothetical protein